MAYFIMKYVILIGKIAETNAETQINILQIIHILCVFCGLSYQKVGHRLDHTIAILRELKEIAKV